MPMTGALLAVERLHDPRRTEGRADQRFSSKFSKAVVHGNLLAVERAYKELVTA